MRLRIRCPPLACEGKGRACVRVRAARHLRIDRAGKVGYSDFTPSNRSGTRRTALVVKSMYEGGLPHLHQGNVIKAMRRLSFRHKPRLAHRDARSEHLPIYLQRRKQRVKRARIFLAPFLRRFLRHFHRIVHKVTQHAHHLGAHRILQLVARTESLALAFGRKLHVVAHAGVINASALQLAGIHLARQF